MRIGLLSFEQSDYDRPFRYISKRDAKLGVLRGTHKKLSKKLFKELVSNITLSSNPSRHAVTKSEVIVQTSVQASIQTLKEFKPPSTLNLYYPVSDKSSYAIRNFNEIWGCNIEEWQRRMGAS